MRGHTSRFKALQRSRKYHIDYPHEIIEVPAILYDTHKRKTVAVFHSYCRPTLRPNLSDFCKDLTGIQQETVDAAPSFAKVLHSLEDWMFQVHELGTERRNFAIVCDNYADMARFMRLQCGIAKVTFPSWATSWINLSKAFYGFYRPPPTAQCHRRAKLSSMLADLGLEFAGKEHNGLHDAVNIMRVAHVMQTEGCQLHRNEQFNLNSRTSFASPLTFY